MLFILGDIQQRYPAAFPLREPKVERSSRRLNQLVGGKDTICRKHNLAREPKCNFTITTLARSAARQLSSNVPVHSSVANTPSTNLQQQRTNVIITSTITASGTTISTVSPKTIFNDSSNFTIPRNSVFIAVNDWASNGNNSQTTSSSSNSSSSSSSITISSDERKSQQSPTKQQHKQRLPTTIVKSEEKIAEINTITTTATATTTASTLINQQIRRNNSNDNGNAILAARKNKMYKQQHIYENECIIQRGNGVCGNDGNNCNSSFGSSTVTMSASGEAAVPIYAVINKVAGNKARSNEGTKNIPLMNNHYNRSNYNQHSYPQQVLSGTPQQTDSGNKQRPLTAVTTSVDSSDQLSSNGMGNVLAVLNGDGNGHSLSGLTSSNCILPATANSVSLRCLNNEAMVNVSIATNSSATVTTDAICCNHLSQNGPQLSLSTTTIASSAATSASTLHLTEDNSNNSPLEQSIYAKVWKGPRKTSESTKMFVYCIICFY